MKNMGTFISTEHFSNQSARSSYAGQFPTAQQGISADQEGRIDSTLYCLIIYCSILCCVQTIAFLSGDSEFTTNVNAVGPIALAAGCVTAVYFLVRISRRSILSPVTWSLVATSFYFGQGPLTYFIGNEASIGYSQLHFFVTPEILASTNLLNTSFLCLTVLAVFLCRKLKVAPPKGYQLNGFANEIVAARWLAIVCLVLGLSVRAGIPALIAGENVIGMIGSLDALVEVSIAPLAFLWTKGNRRDQIAFLLALTFCVCSSFIMFQKTAMMKAYVLAIIGLILAGASGRNIFAIIVIACMSFAFTSTAVGNLRDSFNKEFRNQEHTVSRHLKCISDLWENGELFVSTTETQGWLLRTNYVPTQAFAMDQYDRGYPGDSYRNAFWVLVPRIIYPDKPNMTGVGSEFSVLFNGNDASSVSIGLSGEAYHNGGAIFVIIVGLIVGLFYHGADVLLKSLEGSLWTFFPCVVMMLSMGLRVDGHFVPDFLGTSVIIVGYIAVIYILIMAFPSLGKKGTV